jgi:hypothetical protein
MRAAIAIALAALVAVVPTAEAKKHAKPCSRKGSATVASSKTARVYRVKNSDGGNDLIGCLRSSNKRQLLAHGYDDQYVTSGVSDHVRLAGRFVAWQFTAVDVSCKGGCPPGYDPTFISLYIRDLRARKTTNVDGEVAPKGRLVLTTGGAIAWSQNTQTDVEIDAFDAAGRRQLDHGSIPPGSLRLSGDTASWTNDAQPRTATLAPRG